MFIFHVLSYFQNESMCGATTSMCEYEYEYEKFVFSGFCVHFSDTRSSPLKICPKLSPQHLPPIRDPPLPDVACIPRQSRCSARWHVPPSNGPRGAAPGTRRPGALFSPEWEEKSCGQGVPPGPFTFLSPHKDRPPALLGGGECGGAPTPLPR